MTPEIEHLKLNYETALRDYLDAVSRHWDSLGLHVGAEFVYRHTGYGWKYADGVRVRVERHLPPNVISVRAIEKFTNSFNIGLAEIELNSQLLRAGSLSQ